MSFDSSSVVSPTPGDLLGLQNQAFRRWLRTCDRTAFVAFGLWLALVAGIALSGCTPGICGRSSDCASGLVCTTVGACIVPPVDAGADDGVAIASDAPVTIIRDADGDAFDIEPIDARAAIDAAATVDSDNTIDVPNDDSLTGAR